MISVVAAVGQLDAVATRRLAVRARSRRTTGDDRLCAATAVPGPGPSELDRFGWRRCGLAPAGLLLMIVAVGVSGPPAFAAELGSGGDIAGFGRDPGKNVALAVWLRPAANRTASLTVVVRPVDAHGRPRGHETAVGDDAYPGPGLVGAVAAIAFDTRHHRFLVAWTGHGPGMVEQPCDSGPDGSAPAAPAPVVAVPPRAPCRRADREIFVRELSAAGRPLTAPRQLTATGPVENADAVGTNPALAYDRRRGHYLLVYNAVGADHHARLVAQSLGSHGVPIGASRIVSPSEPAESPLPQTALAAARGGFLLAFTWGANLTEQRVYASRLTGDGQRSAGPYQVSPATGPGAGGLRLTTEPKTGDALAVWAAAVPGASRGWRARRLAPDGRPTASSVSLPYTVGTGPIVAAPLGGGWLYGFVEERPALERAILIQRARSDGRPVGPTKEIAGEDAVHPQLAPLDHNRLLVGWTRQAVMRGNAPPDTGGPQAIVTVAPH